MGEMKRSRDYLSFRESVPQKKLCIDDDSGKEWVLYDSGPKNVRCPLICLPPVSGTADVFFKQMIALSAVGCRVIAVEYPVYWSIGEWCEGFRKLLDYLHLDKVHVFGASLGGFLAQKFAQYTCKSPRVHSLLLCNSFVDTSVFQQSTTAHSFWLMPALLLKKMVMGNFDTGIVDKDIADSIDFMVDKLDSMSQQELASRLTLNCLNSYVEPQKISNVPVTLMDVYDESALSQLVREETYKCYPDAKRAHMKSGGNFPYLSRADEVNLYIQIHLRPFAETKYSAMDQISD
ncbi:maspardin-like [Tubulanus polymorphus]|uniref:maspardin-like n=1 Tax=Tubulanus polymorphus TaxID=672921 RepID=UPI003DA5F61D